MIIQPLTGKAALAVAGATGRVNIFEGAVRSAKTIATLLWWLRYIRTGPAGELLMVGKTERTLRRNIINPLVGMLGPKRCRLLAGSGEAIILGRRVYLAGANDERAADKIRGLTLAGAYVDEITTLPESFWVMLLTRLSVDGAQLVGTTNPDGPNHWLKVNYLDQACWWLDPTGVVRTSSDPSRLDAGIHRASFVLTDNPTLPPGYIAALKHQFTGLWYRRLVEGAWCLAEGSIFDMWDPARHIVQSLPPIHRQIALGVDYGTVNPFAGLLLGAGADGRLYLTNEWRWDSRRRHQQLTDAEYSSHLRGWLDELGVWPERICVDPSASSFIRQLHRDGFSPTDADNSVLDGIRTVASLLALDLLKVHESCEGWIEEAPSYTWDPKAAALGADKPLKTNDHSLDAGRYGIHTTESVWRPLLTTSIT